MTTRQGTTPPPERRRASGAPGRDWRRPLQWLCAAAALPFLPFMAIAAVAGFLRPASLARERSRASGGGAARTSWRRSWLAPLLRAMMSPFVLLALPGFFLAGLVIRLEDGRSGSGEG